MAKMIILSAQKRSKISQKILDTINEVGQDNIIEIVMDEGGKFAEFAGKKVFASTKAYVYYKD